MRATSANHALARDPLAWILAAIVVLRVVGIGWGLPASDGWDNDGVAPRDFLAGLVETVRPGHYYTYPPAHLALLALATAPITAVALARAPSLTQADVIARMLEVPTMTAIAIVARLVSLAMSIGVVWAVAKTAEELAGKRAGWWAAAFVGVNAPLTYYAHTTNLDVPYLFWGSLAMLALVRAVNRDDPRLLRRWAVLAAIAVATKDQAYALFLLAAPAAVALWAMTLGRERRRLLQLEAAVAVVLGAGILVAVDGVLYNPAGFRARVGFLLGPASQAYAQYSSDWLGRWYVLRDTAGTLDHFYPWVLSAFAPLGLLLLLRDGAGRSGRVVAALLPLLVAVSFFVAFNCVARRTDERFVLPQSVMLAVYGGIGLDAAFSRIRPMGGWVARAAVVASLAWGLFEAAAVDVNLLGDPRYAAEAWLRDHLRPGDTIETYGLNVYMPRFPPGSHVIRVGPDASDHRNPMPGVEEVLDAYDNARGRGARYIVVSAGWGWRYLIDARAFPTTGRPLPARQRQTAEDARATTYFGALVLSAYTPYRLVYDAAFESKIWPRVDLHASTSREIWIYERTGG
jgi:hypothetical protein